MRFRDLKAWEFTNANFGFARNPGQNLASHPDGGWNDQDHSPHAGDFDAGGVWLF